MLTTPDPTKKIFKTGERIYVLSRFAHLYANDCGVIVKVIADSHRPIFNEYMVEFPDTSFDHLFQFQIHTQK